MNEFASLFREFESSLRNLKINSIENQVFDLEFKKPFFRFLYQGYSTVDKIRDLGGIITGSRALKCYYLNKKCLLSRKPNDWDIILQKDSFLKFCVDNEIDISFKEKYLSVNFRKGYSVFTNAYTNDGLSRVFPHHFHIISMDELPPFNETSDGYRIDKVENIFQFKLSFIEPAIMNSLNLNNDSFKKHISDLMELKLKLSSI